VAPYFVLLPETSGQRVHPLREVFNALRYIVKSGVPRRLMPNDLPPWEMVCQQARRWLRAGCFEAGGRFAHAAAFGRGGAAPSRVQPSSTVEPCVRRRNVEREPAMMVADARKAPSCIWPSIRWATSWPCMSPRPTLTTGPRSGRWPRPSRRQQTRAWKSPSSIRAIPATGLQRLLRNTALNWMIFFGLVPL
jgi:hypothetical protein